MNQKTTINVMINMLMACSIAINATAAETPAAKPTAEQIEFFEKKIRPVLVSSCYECHSAKAKKIQGGLLLDSRAGLLKGGDSGPAVVPGKVDGSMLIEALNYESVEMPPKGKLPQAVIDDFTLWAKMGLPDPRDGKVVVRREEVDFEAGRKFWAFQPVQKPSVPAVNQQDCPRSDIDRFVLAKLEQNKLKPVELADRRTLIRRATFGLIGLPPNPEEVETFVADQSPQAFEKVVNRLLASKHFGERWGRHWLDLARYGEDQAHTFKARRYPNAYFYRDWVVNALNNDMPYDRFITEQIAGDLLDGPDRLQRLPALGLFALGPVYYQDNGEKKKALADEWDDRVDTLTRGLLGLTVSCARCHNHKYDPISTKDYYALAGIFASSAYREYPLAPQETLDKKQQADAAVKGHNQKVAAFLNDQSRELRTALPNRIASYVFAAWQFYNKRKVNSKTKLADVAKPAKLSEFLLKRWVNYLTANARSAKPHLAQWRDLVAKQDPQKDLSGDESAANAARQVAQSLQDRVVSVLPRKDALFKRFGDNVAFVKAIDRVKVSPGQIPLGNLFDDRAGTSLSSALASDKFKATANPNSLGVDRIVQGWGTVTEVAAGIRFDFDSVDSDANRYGAVTNDGWNKNGPIRTRGQKLGGGNRLIEQGIGMHANSLITFDLKEIRQAGGMPLTQKFRFRVDRAGLNDDVFGTSDTSVQMVALVCRESGASNGIVVAGVVNGVPVETKPAGQIHSFSGKVPPALKANGRFVAFDIPIPGDARWLTLVSTGAGTGPAGNTISSDHAVFSGARLELDPLPKLASADKQPEPKPVDETDRNAAVLLSELLSAKGVLAVPVKETEKLLAGQPKQQLVDLRKQLDSLKKSAAAIKIPKTHSLAEGKAADLNIYLQGNPEKLGDIAPRGFLTVLSDEAKSAFETKGSGRLELARAIADKNNPLTARVIVNRVWQGHFGYGLVRTPSNFGQLGDRPTHPRLLDYLVTRFLDSGWSLKSLHRDILLSSTYQLSSRFDKTNYEVDPDNKLLWRMNRRRLEVEPWRDSMLAVTGDLDLAMGGPSINLASAGNRRRTLYGFVSRHKLDDLLRLFDFPDPNITSDQRSVTTVPLQLLFVLNSEFMVTRAKALAKRLTSDAETSDSDRVRTAFLLLYGRSPSSEEMQLGIEFLTAVTAATDNKNDTLSAWEQYGLALLGSNEFAFVD